MLEALSRRASLFVRRLRKFFAAPGDPVCAARLQEEQFAALRRNTPGMMAANMGNALALLATFIDTPLLTRVAVWTNALLAVCLHIYLRARRGSGRRRSAPQPSSIGRRAVINAAILGGLWAAVPPLFFLDASPGARLMVTSLTAGMLFGGAFALSRAPIAATVFSAPIALSGAATLLSAGDADLSRIAFVLCIYTAVLLRNVYVEAAAFRDRVLSQMGAERQARTDALTGLPNRLAFTDMIEREFARLARYGGGFMLLLVDIDEFKMVNDRYGHPAGDELLSQAARRMRGSLRAVDFVARLGGDEFAIIATDVANDDSARAVARRVAACFDEPFTLDGRVVQGGASVGGAIAPRDGDNQKALFKSADVALYEAKAKGEWRLFTRREDSDRALPPLSEEELRAAFSKGDLSLAYQPVLNLATDEIAGFEALLRWRSPTRGEIPPADFIPLAEATGLIHDIGHWTIESACAAAARFSDRLRVCVNISPVQFQRADFAERLLDILAQAGLVPGRLEIEIAERAMLCDMRLFEEQLRKISDAGVSIALDDFGAGYAALAQFCKSPLDQVKIDGPLAREAATRKECAAIVSGVTQMAKSFQMTVVAEGVETREQLEWLRNAGVDEAQGFLIAAPMPLDRLEAFVAGWSPARRPAVAALSA